MGNMLSGDNESDDERETKQVRGTKKSRSKKPKSDFFSEFSDFSFGGGVEEDETEKQVPEQIQEPEPTFVPSSVPKKRVPSKNKSKGVRFHKSATKSKTKRNYY